MNIRLTLGLLAILTASLPAFEPRDGGTLARDVVRYAVPFDWLLHCWFIRPDIEKIFAYRQQALHQRFRIPPASP